MGGNDSEDFGLLHFLHSGIPCSAGDKNATNRQSNNAFYSKAEFPLLLPSRSSFYCVYNLTYPEVQERNLLVNFDIITQTSGKGQTLECGLPTNPIKRTQNLTICPFLLIFPITATFSKLLSFSSVR